MKIQVTLFCLNNLMTLVSMKNFQKYVLFFVFLSIALGGYGQITTPELVVEPGDTTSIAFQGVEKLRVSENGISVLGTISLRTGHHGKLFFETSTPQKTDTLNLPSLFPEMAIADAKYVLVKITATADRTGYYERASFDMILQRKGSSSWKSSNQLLAQDGQYASGWAYGYKDNIILTGHGPTYIFFGTLEVLIPSF